MRMRPAPAPPPPPPGESPRALPYLVAGGAVVLIAVAVAVFLAEEKEGPEPGGKPAVAPQAPKEKKRPVKIEESVKEFNAGLRETLGEIAGLEKMKDLMDQEPEFAQRLPYLVNTLYKNLSFVPYVIERKKDLPLAQKDGESLCRVFRAALKLLDAFGRSLPNTNATAEGIRWGLAETGSGPAAREYAGALAEFEKEIDEGLGERLEEIGLDLDLLRRVLSDAGKFTGAGPPGEE